VNAEDVKAGRWRTLPDGRRVMVTVPTGEKERNP